MKNTKKHLSTTLIAILFSVFVLACGNTSQNDNQNHSDMMDDDQTEMVEGDNEHMHDEQSDEHMMNDTTTMEMNEEMRQ